MRESGTEATPDASPHNAGKRYALSMHGDGLNGVPQPFQS
jgi:hypothetical protein